MKKNKNKEYRKRKKNKEIKKEQTNTRTRKIKYKIVSIASDMLCALKRNVRNTLFNTLFYCKFQKFVNLTWYLINLSKFYIFN